MTRAQTKEERRPGWFLRYVLGLGVGGACVLYGSVAFIMGRTFLPGLRLADLIVTNGSGRILAGAYLLGGLFLLLRFYARHGKQPVERRPWLYWLQNLTLAGFVGALGYVLFNVGAVH